MGFRVIYEFDDGSVEDVLDEVFETEEEAEEAAQEGASNYSQGRENMEDDEICENEIVDWYIAEE